MATAFYVVAALTLIAYVTLDGFDLGVGILHRALARTDEERRTCFAAIGPYWDGNEVWLLALGGALFVAFPSVLGSALAGLYLAIFLLVWLLLGRGLSIELRGHVQDPLWRSFWDTAFVLSSLGVTLVLGIALGNLVRGFDLDSAGDFQLALFDDLSPHHATGIIDAYTLSTGVYALLVLCLHGARFLAWKSAGELSSRADAFARRLAPIVALVWVGVAAFSASVRPDLFARLQERPLAWPLVALSVGGLVLAARGRERPAFLGSSAHLVGLLGTLAVLTFPELLHAHSGTSLTIANAAAGARTLASAARWYPFALVLAFGYLVTLLRWHRGKVRLEDDAH